MSDNFDLALKKREKKIILTSIIGIISNALLVVFKLVVGLVSNSIAVILDAVNNASDALSSVVTIIGTKLGARKPDKKHPLGHGRVEYISALVVSGLVLYAGITSLIESVKKIISPETPKYSMTSILIIAVAILVKVVLGLYVKKQGKAVQSSTLYASGSDALLDAVLSFSTLISAVIFIIFGFSLEAYVGVLISIYIMKSGVDMLQETLSDIIGKRGDGEQVRQLKEIICEEKEVMGAYDVIIFNYGPNKNYASVHIELPDNLSVSDVDAISRRIQLNVFKKTGIILTGIGVYSHNTSDETAAHMRNEIQKLVLSNPWALQLHGFYVDNAINSIHFDVVVAFDIDKSQAQQIIDEQVRSLYPDYNIAIVIDSDFSDI